MCCANSSTSALASSPEFGRARVWQPHASGISNFNRRRERVNTRRLRRDATKAVAKGAGYRASGHSCHFSPTALRNVALIRDCHPGPVARKCASTSGSSRMFTGSFGAAFFGRPPRRTSLSPSYKSALANHSSVSSGASSGSTQVALEACFFPAMSVPHRYYPPPTVPWRPDHHDEPLAQEPGRDEASLAIVMPIIGAREMPARENQLGIREIQRAAA